MRDCNGRIDLGWLLEWAHRIPPWGTCARRGWPSLPQCTVASINDVPYPDLVCHQLWTDTGVTGSSYFTPAFTEGTVGDALSEINLRSYGLLVYDKGAKNIHHGKCCLFNKWLWKPGPLSSQHSKINHNNRRLKTKLLDLKPQRS